MQLPLQSFSTLLQTMAAGVQGAASQLLDLTVGSVLRAILEANASIALWVQWLVVQVLRVTRAATSTGVDLDSWVADFSLTRLPPSAAAGTVVLARYTPSLAAFVPVATQVRSSDGSMTFAIAADATNPAWNAALDGYNIGAGVAAIAVPVIATTTGAAGNLQPNTATVLGSAIAGVDTVTNPAALSGGMDAESDAALRTRFANFINSRARATPLAVATAVQGLQPGIAYTIAENSDALGNDSPGSFLVTIDDGSGAPPTSLLSAAIGAIEAVRPIGSVFTVRGPGIFYATVVMSLGVADPATRPTAVAAVSLALRSYIGTLPIGGALAWSRLAQVAYDASSLVTNVTGVALNGAAADMAVPAYGVIKPGTVAVA